MRRRVVARRPTPAVELTRRPTPLAQIIYKIDIPANRYVMLCVEVRAAGCAAAPQRLDGPWQGIARALNVFRGVQPAPTYTLVEPTSGVRQRMVRRTARCVSWPRLTPGGRSCAQRRCSCARSSCALCCGTSRLTPHGTTASSTCRTSCTRTSAASGRSSPSARTTWTRCRVRSRTRRCRRRCAAVRAARARARLTERRVSGHPLRAAQAGARVQRRRAHGALQDGVLARMHAAHLATEARRVRRTKSSRLFCR